MEDLDEFDPDFGAFLQGGPHGDRDGGAIGFVQDAVEDFGG